MSEKLQRAIASIKAGNQQAGRQLLAQILQAEPNNETAWLWMSAVVDEDKRRYCIERVLKINPNNPLARRALEKLKEMEAGTGSPEPTPLPPAQSIAHVQSQPATEPETDAHVTTEEARAEIEQTRDAGKPPISITKTAVKDGIKMGVIGGVVGVLPMAISIPARDMFLVQLSFVFAAIVCGIVGLSTGIIFFRRRIGATLSVGLGGGLSGLITGMICGLGVGYLTNGILWHPLINNREVLIDYLTACGGILPLITGSAGALTVWMPATFFRHK